MAVSAQSGQVAEVRRTLVDPVRVCERLGLAKGARRQSTGLSIRCPAHAERTPSCSVTRGPDGTIRVRCFGSRPIGATVDERRPASEDERASPAPGPVGLCKERK